MKTISHTVWASLYTLGAVLSLIAGLNDFQGLRRVYLSVALILAFLSWIWIVRARE